jgi:signal transduction histidine kinase
LYISLVVGSAALLLVHDLRDVPAWPHPWSIGVTIALIVLTALGDQVQFEIRRGWYTNASATAHVAVAFLLPPGVAIALAPLGVIVRAIRHPATPQKTVFNVANMALAVGAAAHVAAAFGGPDRVGPAGAWTDPLVAVLVSATYCAVSATLVALAVAIDKRSPVWEVIRGNLPVQSLGEVGLGVVGAMVAAMLSSAPNWAPMLLVPAGLLYMAKLALDRADRRSRNMALTSAVGRAVAGTLDLQRAFQAITAAPVLDRLSLDGLALVPIEPERFGAQVASEADQPTLRRALVEQLAVDPHPVRLRTGPGQRRPAWVPPAVGQQRLAVAAIPFGAGANRSIGALIAWRDLDIGRRASFDADEILVLETLADYAAVALETARLTQETARLNHEAGQAEARREMESLREIARLKDEFLGQVSHELRTPLTIIHGYAELMVDGLVQDPDSIRESAREIHSSSTLMLRLVDDLLDTSRLEAGRIELKPAPLELASWLVRLATAFGQATQSHRVVTAVPQTLPTLVADPDRLGQIMHNLLSNAARYSPEGSQIRVAADQVGDTIEIKVTDQGAGIAPEDCERIFEKFYRGRHGATLAVRGTGLGLAVARQLVEAHGGSIGVRSIQGAGSTFWIRLPLRPAAELSPARAA